MMVLLLLIITFVCFREDIKVVIDEVRKSRHGGHFKGMLFSDIVKEVKGVVMHRFASSLRAPVSSRGNNNNNDYHIYFIIPHGKLHKVARVCPGIRT
jgi:hypothetical protein